MPMTISTIKPTASPSTSARAAAPRERDHDLPVLAAEQHAGMLRPQWDQLLSAGIQPALVLGAERRLEGKRQGS